MQSAQRRCSFLGVRIAPTMQHRVESVFRDVLLLPQLQTPAVAGYISAPRIRFGSGKHWIETCAEATHPSEPPESQTDDAVHWQCSDLLQQRRHLERMRINVADAQQSEGVRCLRIEPIDTGACAIVLLDEFEAAASHSTAPDIPTRLLGMEMSVRAPERVAVHWAQMLQLSNERSDGVPCVRSSDVVLRFRQIETEGDSMWSLDFATAQLAATCVRAYAHGFTMDAACTGFYAMGLHFRLVAI